MANAVEASEIAASNEIAMSEEIPTVTENDQTDSSNDKDLIKDGISENKMNVVVDEEKTNTDTEVEEKVEVIEVKCETESGPKAEEPNPEPEPKKDSDLEPEAKQNPDPEIESKQEPDMQGDHKQISEPEVESKQNSEPEADVKQNQGLEPEQELEPEPEAAAEGEIDEEDEDEEDEVDDEEEYEMENVEGVVEKPLDDDQDRRNPQYIPKGGAFYEHDNRTSLEDVENKDPQENEKKKKSWKESKESERWLHDCYNESEQQPKSTKEIIETYGYDIRNEDAPPRARRRRKYGRGPDKYERSWEDEQAYLVKPNNIGRRLKKKTFGKDEFPPLPNQKQDAGTVKSVQKSSPRRREDEGPSKYRNSKVNGNDRSPGSSQVSRHSSGNHNQLPSYNSNKKSYNHVNKKMEDDVKPYRNDGGKWKSNFKQGKQDDISKPIKSQTIRHSDPPFKRIVETNKNSVRESDVSHITDGINQMTFHSRQVNMRDIRPKSVNGPEENKINEAESESPANRQNPKRYSKIRKGFTGIFPPEEVPELDQTDIHKLQQEQQKSQHMNMTQPLNMQSVMKRYAGTFDFVPGNTSYLGARPIISGIPQQGMSPQGLHQQTLSPQGIPQQALSPQVTSLQPIELQQNPLAQPNFVPQPMYIDMDAHYPSDVMGPYNAYPPYSGNQTGDVYQPPRGITYYNTECQNSGQKRPPPPRRQKAAIPIVRPPE
ncbi:UNVERIFIED_CONTAM: hypothetical protein PYX00_002275 [Menopon gallinae]|uniref:Protein CASC3 n=1 Tax=Menopon gallinae TaxID=328185 RepID=A0AAW2IGD4_9NEOP